ncbi:MAG: hypothetical protein ACD_46C00463G0001 [uncultured bacterium]|nr:MAG: hypothetical protein ACD_46C00463G0001 [uncultured bacterium]
MKIKRLTLTSILSFCFLFIQCSFATTIDKIVVFGDSLSDNGNLYALTQKASKVIPFMPIIPKNPPYYAGRFSNGLAWVEDLAIAMNVPLLDYAYGGSWAEPFHDSGLIVPFSLSSQVDMYMVSAITDYDIGKHLFVIWTGSNDYLNGRDNPDYATTNVVSNIQDQIDWLVYYGAKNFLLLGVPDLTVVPGIIAKGPKVVENAALLVKYHNKKLSKLVKNSATEYPGVNFVYGDIATAMDDIIANPEEYRLKNVISSCYTGPYYLGNLDLTNDRGVEAAKQAKIDLTKSTSLKMVYLNGLGVGGQVCSNPDEYLFWDQIHPTRVTHQIVAMNAAIVLYENGITGPNSIKPTALKN